MQIRLTTTGRRSGEAREVTLYGWPDGDDMIVVGSRGGHDHDPAWAGNLRAHPAATIKIGRDQRSVIAREENGPQRDRLWALVCEAFPLYATYQRKTSRIIPLFVLEQTHAS